MQGSSRYFIVAIVTFSDHSAADDCDKRIGGLRTELKLNDSFEFHFSNNSKKIRTAFLDAVHRYPFSYWVFALNKGSEKLYGPGFNHKESLYKWCARTTFDNAKNYLDNATVVVDGSGRRGFRDELAAYLRQRIRDPDGARLIKKVKVQRSSGNNLLQLADYVAGVSNRAICQRADGLEMLNKYLANKQLSCRVWP